MITLNAISSIERLFEKSIRENCHLGPDDDCTVTNLSALASIPKPEARKLVALNISSYIFRIVAFVDFNSQDVMVTHLNKSMNASGEKLHGQPMLDAYAEFMNMICGSVNRGLSAEFRNIGMSTPFFLDHACANYLTMLDPTIIKSFEVVINGVNHFNLTVCICVAKGKSLDFDMPVLDHEEGSSGELELF